LTEVIVPLEQQEQVSSRRWVSAVRISLFAGGLGADRFYLGFRWLGLLKLVTFGGLGLWAFADFISLLNDNLRDADGLPLKR
jgi:TM2 domain-containing membrane protein YozV